MKVKTMVLLFVAFFLSCCTNVPTSSDLFIEWKKGRKLEADCNAYIFFIFPGAESYDQTLSHGYSDKEVKLIRKYFKIFGDTISVDDCAIWINSGDSISDRKKAVDIISIINSHNTGLKNLRLDAGPLIVFLNYNPTGGSVVQEPFYTAINFHGSRPDGIVQFMNRLTQMIIEKRIKPGSLEIAELMFLVTQFISNFDVGRIGLNIITLERYRR